MKVANDCAQAGRMAIGNRRAAQEHHRHVEDLDEDVAFGDRVRDRGDDEADGAKREARRPRRSTNSENGRAGSGMPQNEVRQPDDRDDSSADRAASR